MPFLRLTASEGVPARQRSAVDDGLDERMSAAWGQKGGGHGRYGYRCRRMCSAAVGIRRPGYQTVRRLRVLEGAAGRVRKMRKRVGDARKGQQQQGRMRPLAGEQASTGVVGAADTAGGAGEALALVAAAGEPKRSSRVPRRLSGRRLLPYQPFAPECHLPTFLLPSTAAALPPIPPALSCVSPVYSLSPTPVRP